MPARAPCFPLQEQQPSVYTTTASPAKETPNVPHFKIKRYDIEPSKLHLHITIICNYNDRKWYFYWVLKCGCQALHLYHCGVCKGLTQQLHTLFKYKTTVQWSCTWPDNRWLYIQPLAQSFTHKGKTVPAARCRASVIISVLCTFLSFWRRLVVKIQMRPLPLNRPSWEHGSNDFCGGCTSRTICWNTERYKQV